MIALEPTLILALLDALPGIAPVGFEHAELLFDQGEGPSWTFNHGSFIAPPEALQLGELVDGPACSRALSRLATDFGSLWGGDWDGRLALSRTASGHRLDCAGARDVAVDRRDEARCTFNEDVLAELGRERSRIVTLRATFEDRYGALDGRWQLDPAMARLHTPQGDLACALIGVHQRHELVWAPEVRGPPAALLEPVRALAASDQAPKLLSRGKLVVHEALLSLPLAWLVALPLGAEATLLWPHEQGAELVLAALAL